MKERPSSSSSAAKPSRDLNERIANLAPAKRALLEMRLKQKSSSTSYEHVIPRRTGIGSAPLSFGQQWMWLVDQLEPGTPTYYIAQAVRLGGSLKATALERSIEEIVRGIAENPRRERVAPRRFRYFFELVSDQRVLRVRRGDELRLLDGRTFKVVVLDVAHEGETTRLSLELVEGMRAVGLPVAGWELELTSRLPDWGRVWRERGHLSTRLARTPWTHSEDRPPAARPRQAPLDPLAEVEGLR